MSSSIRSSLGTLALPALLALSACGGESDPTTDTGDSPADASHDADTSDAAPDDASEDSTADATPDGLTDTATDAPTDADATEDADAAVDTSSDADGSELPPEPTAEVVFAEEGGTIEHADSELLVPGGALAEDTTLTVDARLEAIEGLDVVGAVYEFGPDGTEFSVPVRVSLPLGDATAESARVWWTNRDGEFEPIPTFIEGDRAIVYVSHFSQGVVVTCGATVCPTVDPVCLDATTLQVTTASCRNGTCVGDTSPVDCSVALPNMDGQCNTGACVAGPCTPGYSNCDSVDSNGCETFGPCAVCGDGVVQAGEGCDDGNVSDGDGCSATCLAEGCAPSAEVCDGVDNNCDGNVDEGLRRVFYADVDGDGVGVSSQTVLACTAPLGYATVAGDCNDTDALIRPTATETCGDGIDNNCDRNVDEGCSVCGDGIVDAGEQCDDGNPTPGDGCEPDCTFTPVTCVDPDGDGYGPGCAAGEDCDNADADVHPGAIDICNGIDDNCDSNMDDEFDTGPCVSSSPGICSVGVPTCVAGVLLCEGGSPGTEICGNGIDEDCDGVTDNGCVVCVDDDGDGYGPGCAAGADCDNTNPLIFPGATERCNGIDDNCDSSIDEGCPLCGNGVVDAAEQCDDGNPTPGDGCEPDCTLTP